MNTEEEIKGHLAYGDWGKVAKLVGISRRHVSVVICRPGSKHYAAVMAAAKKVAQANVKLGL